MAATQWKSSKNVLPEPMPDKNSINIQALARNIQKNPDDLFSKFALALELLKQNRVDKARLLFESVYRQDPGYTGVYYHLGKLYEQIGLTEEALRLYREGIDVAGQKNELRTKSELLEAINQIDNDPNQNEH